MKVLKALSITILKLASVVVFLIIGISLVLTISILVTGIVMKFKIVSLTVLGILIFWLFISIFLEIYRKLD